MMKGKLVLVPFPFDDLSATKVRPAVVLTEPIGTHRHIVIAFITSQVPELLLDTDLTNQTTHPDFSQTGLRVTSTVRVHRLLTITSTFIQRELGVLSPQLQSALADKVRKLFSLS